MNRLPIALTVSGRPVLLAADGDGVTEPRKAAGTNRGKGQAGYTAAARIAAAAE